MNDGLGTSLALRLRAQSLSLEHYTLYAHTDAMCGVEIIIHKQQSQQNKRTLGFGSSDLN